MVETAQQNPRFTPGQKKLLIIFAIFFVPLTLAVSWYLLMPAHLQPGISSRTNHGDLILPVYEVQAFEQQQLNGDRWTAANLETKWTIVHFLDQACDEACSKHLYNTRQIRMALGKDIERVQRIVLVNTETLGRAEEKMWASHPDLKILIGEDGLAAQIKQQQTHSANSVYLIDPMGSLMMHFSPDLEPKLMLKDIRKLLRMSHIG